MIFATSDDPTSQDFIAFWQRVYRDEELGIKLAIWCDAQPGWASEHPVDAGPPRVIFGWPGGETVVSLSGVLARPELLDGGVEVVMARPSLPLLLFEELKRRMGFSSEVRGDQVAGWWLRAGDNRERDRGRPTGALVPESGSLSIGTSCLVLVEVADRWLVLSERGLYTYVFGEELLQSKETMFLSTAGDRWQCRLEPSIPWSEVRERFGDAAAGRTRQDAGAIIVSIHRETAG